MSASNRPHARSSSKRADAGAAPVPPPSERAQAQRFAKILRRELTEMGEKVIAAEVEWHLRCESEGYIDPPQRLDQARMRMREIERMLTALKSRFP